MKVLVLNGSPKGEYSITLQTVKYLEACFPEDTFQVLHVGQRIKALEKDFSKAKEMLKEADLWLLPPSWRNVSPMHLLPRKFS